MACRRMTREKVNWECVGYKTSATLDDGRGYMAININHFHESFEAVEEILNNLQGLGFKVKRIDILMGDPRLTLPLFLRKLVSYINASEEMRRLWVRVKCDNVKFGYFLAIVCAFDKLNKRVFLEKHFLNLPNCDMNTMYIRVSNGTPQMLRHWGLSMHVFREVWDRFGPSSFIRRGWHFQGQEIKVGFPIPANFFERMQKVGLCPHEVTLVVAKEDNHLQEFLDQCLFTFRMKCFRRVKVYRCRVGALAFKNKEAFEKQIDCLPFKLEFVFKVNVDNCLIVSFRETKSNSRLLDRWRKEENSPKKLR